MEAAVSFGCAVLICVSAGAASASGSYPSFATRSASSFALRSAASKSRAEASTFFAPSLVFFAPRMFFLGPVELAGFRAAAGMAVAAGVDALRGDFGRAVPLPFAGAFKKGDAVLLTPAAGVPVREGGLEGRLIAGLSQDEKKSSSSAAPGVFEPLAPLSSMMSVMTTSSGYLATSCQHVLHPPFRSCVCALLGILSASSCELFLVLCGGVGCVFGLGILACQGGRSTMCLEVLCRRLISTHFHNA